MNRPILPHRPRTPYAVRRLIEQHEVERYTKMADRARNAKSAMRKAGKNRTATRIV